MPRGRPSREAVIAALDRAVADLSAVGGLPLPAESEEIWKGLWHEETHHSTALEGNTLALRQVAILLEQGRAVGDKELREYLEVQGYAEAANWVYAQAVSRGAWSADELLTSAELREVHRRVVAPTWLQFPPAGLAAGEGPGSFRQHDIRPFQGGMAPPPFPDVPALVRDWLAAVNGGPRDRHPVVYLADTHAAFERLHPFRDGNGRTGRLLLNLLLVRHGYPPAIVLTRERTRYLAALARADGGDPGSLAELLARSVKRSIDRFLLPALAGPLRLVPLTALGDALLSHGALQTAAKRGRLRAVRERSQWYSTRKWVEEYRASRYRRS